MKVIFADINKEDTIQVFGAGYIGKKVVYCLRKCGVSVQAVLDNSVGAQGKMMWEDIPIMAPTDSDRTISVLLCFEKKRIRDEVAKQCKELGFERVYEVKLQELQDYIDQLSDRDFLEMKYYSIFGKKLNLENPSTLNEKLQWLKIHDRNPLYVTLGDKFAAREYLKSRFGEQYLIPLLYMSYDYNDIKYENIPDKHCAIKSNCWSGDVEIIRSKDDVDWDKLRDKFKRIFESDWALSSREWWYSYMKPCVVVEQLLETNEGKLPNDYKLHFFNGHLEFIYCSIDREGENYRKIYSPDWEEMSFSWNGDALPPDTSKPNINKPYNFDLMLKMGGAIASEIPYVRVDFYEVEKKLFFGEVTISHGAGFDHFVPEEYDEIYGRKLVLPHKKGENITNHIEKFREYKAPSYNIWHVEKEKRNAYLKLDWNESTILPTPLVRDKLIEIVTKGNFYQYYPDVNNIQLLSKIADYVGLEPQNIQVFPSSDSAHEYISKVWVRKGDKCGILWPSYDNYRASMELADGEISFCKMVDFRYDHRLVCDYLDTEKPTVFYICNPNNPTGEQIPVDLIKDLLDKYQDILFVIDEAYGEFSNISSCRLIRDYSNIIISKTFSKAFGLANFRIGYLVSAVDNIRLLSTVRNGKNISTFSQEAAVAALEDIEYMRNYVKEVADARSEFQSEVKTLKCIRLVYESVANFVMLELNDYREKIGLIEYLRERQILIRDLNQTEYMKEHCCRVTIGTKEQMRIVIEAMKGYCS